MRLAVALLLVLAAGCAEPSPPAATGLASASVGTTSTTAPSTSSAAGQATSTTSKECGIAGQEHPCGYDDGYSFGYDAAGVATDLCARPPEGELPSEDPWFPGYTGDPDYDAGLDAGWYAHLNHCASPGSMCEAGSSANCTSVGSADGEWRYIEGYSECVAILGSGAGECADLDGDGRSGYADSG